MRVFLILSLIFFVSATSFAGNKHTRKAVQSIQTRSPNLETYFNPDVPDIDQKTLEEKSGSLWTNTYSSRLYDNMYRASKVGDNIMVVIDERARGSNSGNTKSDKKTEQSNSIDELGGLMAKIAGLVSVFDPTNIVSASSESKFKGDATTKREGQLTARMTATVMQVLRNGNMLIRGEQRLKINKEDQVLVVEGIIRPYDIQPDNTVLSSAIANARINFSGFGVVAERQSPGWLVRALDYIWPF